MRPGSLSEFQFDLLHQAVAAAGADEEAEETVFQQIPAGVVVEAHVFLFQREADLPLFSGAERYSAVVLEFLHRADEAGCHVLHVELGNLRALPLAGVLQPHGDLQLFAAFPDPQVLIRKARIAQAVAEGEEKVNVLAVIIAVAYKDPFTILGRVTLAAVEQIRGVVRQLPGEAIA